MSRTSASSNCAWIVAEGPLTGKAKRELLREYGYGIHGRLREPFGIAVAEMVKAGCIPLFPPKADQAEMWKSRRLALPWRGGRRGEDLRRAHAARHLR